MGLTTYQQKRSFTDTPEPEGRPAKAHKRLAFVVQKHKASHLHYDFRLELKGVLKSWAVPKGPSLNPKDKRLAMMVEDHPYDYRKFEGTIPKGNYGAGQVIIWDQGYYEPPHSSKQPEKDLAAQLHCGQLSFVMHGKRLKGEFTLVRTPKAGENAWMLIKKNDDFAAETDITKQTQSVVSGKRIAEPKRAEPSVDISSLPQAGLPTDFKPMLATLATEPFDDPQWLYEVKWDGYRALAAKQNDAVQLFSRSGQDFSQKYLPVNEALSEIEDDFLLDGEIVAVDKDGKAHFEWLQNWGRHQEGSLQYMIFDIVWYNSRNLQNLPLIERKAVLKQVLPDSAAIKYSDHIIGKGAELFSLAKSTGLEGIMAKRAESTYQVGRRSKDWLKIKTHRRQEVVIGGFTEPKGSRKHIGALVLGIYDEDKFVYVGHTGGGIPAQQMHPLRRRLEKHLIQRSPFVNSFKPNAPVHWVRPELVCEVSFSEWTKGGHMRQPIFMGMREDKDARSVQREVPMAAAAAKQSAADRQMPTLRHDLELSHLDKVFWPRHGYTKGDLIDYYKAIAPVMLQYLKDRPHSLLRQPNGISGQAFFQKDVDHSVPDWIQTKTVYSESNQKDIHYLVCDSIDSLLYMVQLGCIEINPWNSRVQSLAKPDWVVIDLDPEDIGFDKVVETAQAVREICEQLELPSYPKTSGKTGIHIFIPLGARYSYEQCKQFGQLLAALTHQRVADFTSLERSPKNRQKKIYLDYLQNRRGQTLAAPYSVRPTADATVSTPLKWEEVNKKLKPTNFTVKNIMKRLDKVGDLWEPVLGQGIDLQAVLQRIE